MLITGLHIGMKEEMCKNPKLANYFEKHPWKYLNISIIYKKKYTINLKS